MSEAKKVVIVDYGAGNVGSVLRAFQHCGADPILTSAPQAIQDADRLVLPGVGAFSAAMERLRTRHLIEPILEFAGRGRPLFGICLGMQMLADESEEFGLHGGLGLIAGRVISIPRQTEDGRRIKVPNVGWATIRPPQQLPQRWGGTVFNDLAPDEYFYFVHSYHAVTKRAADVLAETTYNGNVLSAAIQRDNVFGAQFHPEKSGWAGMAIINSFLKL